MTNWLNIIGWWLILAVAAISLPHGIRRLVDFMCEGRVPRYRRIACWFQNQLSFRFHYELVLRCKICNRLMEPSNVENHQQYFHRELV